MNWQEYYLTPEHKNIFQKEEPKKIIKILIADDDKLFRSFVRESLQSKDKEIELASNGREALEKLKKEPFDLLITDIRMPEMGGIELLEEAKKIHPRLLVIIITGYASLETAIQALKKGAYDYIRKPFNMEELKVSVENACIRIALERENQRLLKNLEEIYKKLEQKKKIEKYTKTASLENFVQEIEKLAQLFKDGFLTEDEYQNLKNLLLERIKR